MATKLKMGDQVKIIAGKDKSKEGKVLFIDRKKNKITVEGIGMISKHEKPNAQKRSGGIVRKEASISISNVMYLHQGKPTRIGFKVEEIVVDGKTVKSKKRFAKSTGEIID